jgi:hypothetical protein
MKKFVVMYRVPVETMEEWRKNTSPEEMKAQGEKIGADMMAWIQKNSKAIIDTGLPLGRNTRMTAQAGAEPKVEPLTNDLNAYVVVEADSVEAVTEMFKDNPHMQIPTAYLDIMEVSHPGM